MIGFEHYSKIKNNYCICYLGVSDEYLIQLRMLYPAIHTRFPELNLYLACKDESLRWLTGVENAVPITLLKSRKSEFVHIKELTFDGKVHPVYDLMTASEVPIYAKIKPTERTTKCVIISRGQHPTVSLMDRQILRLRHIAQEQGYSVEVNTSITGAGLVMGVESPDLFEAISQGIKTTLVPTGFGTELYKKLAPDGDVLSI